MITLHIDTARTWRGGQNQALLTVLGLRALGHRTVLVAHPQGELRRRASEGPDLVPLAPRSELDLAAAWRLARLVRELQPGDRPCPRPARRGDGGLSAGTDERPPRRGPRPRCWWPRAASTSSSSRTHSRAGNTARSRRFICASDCIRQMLVAQGIPAARAVTVHEGIDLRSRGRRAAGQRARGLLAPPQRPGRRLRRRARRSQGPPRPDSCRGAGRARDAGRPIRDSRRGRAARRAHGAREAAGPRATRSPAWLPPRRAVAAQDVRSVRDAVGHRRPGHQPARCDGLPAPDRGEPRWRHPRGRRRRRHRAARAPQGS